MAGGNKVTNAIEENKKSIELINKEIAELQMCRDLIPNYARKYQEEHEKEFKSQQEKLKLLLELREEN